MLKFLNILGHQDWLLLVIRRSLRSLSRTRGFTITAVLTLALGIGGTTVVFTLIDAVMFRPLPVSDPGLLYRIGDGDDTIAVGRHGRWGFFPFALYEKLKSGAPEFEDITAFDWGGNQLSVRRQGSEDGARPLLTEYATGNYFSTLGVSAFRGRVFHPDDDRPSAPPVAVLSHQTWQDTYGGDLSIIGSIVIVQGHPFTVVGVTPPEFFGETVRAYRPDMWIPLQQEPVIAGGGSLLYQSSPSWLVVIGRLRRDASIAGTDLRLTDILRSWIRFESEYPADSMPEILRDLPRQTIQVVPAGAGIGLGGLSLKEQYGPSLGILFAISALVLVVACANGANLLMARSLTLRTQTALRIAIGATRRQIIAEALTESVIIAIAGGIAGLAMAAGIARLMVMLAFEGSQFLPVNVSTSVSVLAFTFSMSLVTGIVFGSAPAWFAARTDPNDALRGSGHGVLHRSLRARTALLIVQATLSVVIVSGATMLAQSLTNLETQDLGYKAEGRVLVALNRLPFTSKPEQLSRLYRDIEQRLASLPGIRAVGLAGVNPLTLSASSMSVMVAGHESTDETSAVWERVSAEYLQGLGVTLLRGRLFTEADDDTTGPVAIVNEQFARRFFRDDENPIDQRFGLEHPDNARTFRIVGVVRDAKLERAGLSRASRPMFFAPLAQHVHYRDEEKLAPLAEGVSHLIQGILLVTDSQPGILEPILRRTLAEVDPNLTITSVRTLEQQVDLSLNQERAVTSLALLFGIVALGLAAVGVYGVMTYVVARQTNEIGIRMALGANGLKIVQLVVRGAFKRVAAGLALGIPLALVTSKLMSSQLYGVSFWDYSALSLAVGLVATCAFIAAVIPALHAAAVSPMIALRSE